MIVVNDRNNLVFDSNSELCHLHVEQCQGSLYAFIQCVDSSLEEHQAGKSKRTRRYWGKFDWNNEESSIKDILRNGGNWPQLPA